MKSFPLYPPSRYPSNPVDPVLLVLFPVEEFMMKRRRSEGGQRGPSLASAGVPPPPLLPVHEGKKDKTMVKYKIDGSDKLE